MFNSKVNETKKKSFPTKIVFINYDIYFLQVFNFDFGFDLL